jgi:hypothetical protein
MRAHTSGQYAAVGLAAIGGRPLVIDEVQRNGEQIRPIVREVARYERVRRRRLADARDVVRAVSGPVPP